MLRLKILFLLTFICVVLTVWGQSESDLNELKKAYVDVQEGKYAEAYPYFKEMLAKYPKDPTYNYYVGRCLLFIDSDPGNALQYLRFASTRNVSSDVYYYLGLAYLQSYKFEEAEANFKWFEKKGGRKESNELDVEMYKSMAQNGLFLIKYFKNIPVVAKSNVNTKTFFKKYDVNIEGKLLDRFEYFNQKVDNGTLPNVIYVPNFLENKEVLYFSAKNKHGDYDIYRITRLSDTLWSNAENLGDIINTPFDENFPFIHSDGSTLYFASKGHYSMGGYDLYKSTWDWEQQNWTEPENLDFPINSPFDDILFVPSLDKSTACFASTREGLTSELTVYKINIDPDLPYQEYISNEQIIKQAKLEVNVFESKKLKNSNKVINQKNLVVKTVEEESFVRKNEYDSLLTLAMELQLRSDSLKWKIDEKRVEFAQVTKEDKRIELGDKIVELERKVYQLQKQADACYEKVRKIEQENIASNNISYKKQDNDPKKELLNEELVKKKIINENVILEPKDNKFEKVIIKSGVTDEYAQEYENYGLRVKLPSVYNSANPIKINENLPEGIVYQIQLGAFSSKKDPALFKGMEPITCTKEPSSSIYKYFAGRFLVLKDAESSLATVKTKGFKDAYIVAFNSGKIIPINSAVKLESKHNKKLQENKGEVTIDNDKKQKKQEELTIVYVLKANVNNNELEKINKYKSNIEGKDFYYNESGSADNLLIKSFYKFEEIDAVRKDIEYKTGIKFEIHAFFAENQIPLDQAIKITK